MEALDQPVMPEEVAVDPLTIIVGTGALVVGAGTAAWPVSYTHLTLPTKA